MARRNNTAVAEAPQDVNNHPLLAAFRETYATIRLEISQAKEITDTEGWRDLYLARRNRVTQRRTKMAAELATWAENLKRQFWSEPALKEFKDTLKSVVELAETEVIYERESIEPLKGPIDRANQTIKNLHRDIDYAIQKNPLYSDGLKQASIQAIQEMGVYEWDEEAGAIKLGS